MFGAPDPEAGTTEQSADTRADTAKYKRRAHKHARYEARYAKYRNFKYLALSGEYLRICSCIFHCTRTDGRFVPRSWALNLLQKPLRNREVQQISRPAFV
jgi:hypothetical protein